MENNAVAAQKDALYLGLVSSDFPEDAVFARTLTIFFKINPNAQVNVRRGWIMDETSLNRRVEQEDLNSFVRAVLSAVGVTDEHALHVADSLVEADLRGVESHGVARLEPYVKNFEAGGFSCDPDIHIEEVAPGIAMIDGDYGPGQSVGARAMDAAIDLAERNGIGTAFVANSNHFGTAAYFTHRAASVDHIGIASTNVGPDVIPFGGTRAFLGTNPIGISIPSDRGFPITLDMATSVVAMGKIDHVASEEDTPIPEEWAVDAAGEPTTDPQAVAALRPMGGPKGYGLAFMVDVLCGLLSGGTVGPDCGDLYGEYAEPMDVGHWFVSIDIASMIEPSLFKSLLDAYVDRVKSEPTAPGVDEILVPGEPEAQTQVENERRGIPLSNATAAGLDRLARRYDLEPVS